MRKILLLLIPLSGAVLTFAGPAPSNFEALHNMSRLSLFASTNQITQYFRTNSLSFEAPPIRRYSDRYFWVISYPYSGLDTIDIYCFRGEPGGWRVQMLYFALKPKDRHMSVVEEESRFVVRNGNTQLLTLEIQEGD